MEEEETKIKRTYDDALKIVRRHSGDQNTEAYDEAMDFVRRLTRLMRKRKIEPND